MGEGVSSVRQKIELESMGQEVVPRWLNLSRGQKLRWPLRIELARKLHAILSFEATGRVEDRDC